MVTAVTETDPQKHCYQLPYAACYCLGGIYYYQKLHCLLILSLSIACAPY